MRNNKKVNKIFLASILVMILVLARIFCVQVIYGISLGTCAPGINTFDLTVPQGESFHFLLVGAQKSILAGDQGNRNWTLEIEDNLKKVYSREIDYASVRDCNWLRRYNQPSALILTPVEPGDGPKLSGILKAGENYKIKMILDSKLTNEVSLWFSWLGRPRLF